MNIKNFLLTSSFMFCLSAGASDPLDLKSDYQFKGTNLKCAKLKDGEGWIPDIEKKIDENKALKPGLNQLLDYDFLIICRVIWRCFCAK